MTNVITAQQIKNWATVIANKVNEYATHGECVTFDNELNLGNGNIITATVNYWCDVRKDEGTCYAPPSWWIESDKTTVVAVSDFNGDEYPELAEALEWWLN